MRVDVTTKQTKENQPPNTETLVSPYTGEPTDMASDEWWAVSVDTVRGLGSHVSVH